MAKAGLIFFFVIPLIFTDAKFVRGQDFGRCTQLIEREFHKESTTRNALYLVNADYFLEVKIQGDCEVSRIDVSPKYFWEHLNHEWKEPKHLVSLTEDEYNNLLAKIGRIRLLGPLVKKGQIGTVTNQKLWLLDKYEQAYVERRLHDFADEVEEINRISSFSVYFVREVKGRVDDKKLSILPNSDKRARLKLDNRWYLVDEEEYEKAQIGESETFRAAGPL